jgi:squalene-hopene/tetraprenyl-beta-curcumene cyclase
MKFLLALLLSFVYLQMYLPPQAQSQSPNTHLMSEISSTLALAQTQTLKLQVNKTYWNYPLYLGSMYTSQYILLRHWILRSSKNNRSYDRALPNSPLDENKFKTELLDTQRTDGSWPIIFDSNTLRGDLNATILHYASLKVMGLKPTDTVLINARKFILKNGGITKASLFTKIALSLTGNYNWSNIPTIPYIVFDENFYLNYKNFGQWIAPHLFPISYLQKVDARKQLGPEFVLNELWIELPNAIAKNNSKFHYENSSKPDFTDQIILLKMLGRQKPQGSFGGYTTATLFTLAALTHYQQYRSDFDSSINSAIERGLNFVDQLYFNSGSSSYMGVTCDGRYWDTALIGQGLLESGVNAQVFAPTNQYLLKIQDQASGGFGFGLDFESYMDTDDTAEILLYFKKSGIHNSKVDRALNWLLSMQNDDGGWGAFDRNNTGNFILKMATNEFNDSADMFDESSPDVTGHILEALAAYGFRSENSMVVRRAIDYLQNHQDDKLPAWSGRWGSNYIYGTSASLIGLLHAGVNPQLEWIQNSVDWLMKCQNKYDGGFGESFDSYARPTLACKGISTPTQTAWALMAMIETGKGESPQAQAAAQYLVRSFQSNGQQWVDKNTFVGTGHPKIVPMHYPSYATAFSMMALARYQKLFLLIPTNN